MLDTSHRSVAIVDYGLGNLFSVRQACAAVGLAPQVTSDRDEIVRAGAVILPGVGAYGDAMAALRRLDLVECIRDLAQSGKPLFGICLGMQLLMSESHEFGRHPGLDVIPGDVVRFAGPVDETAGVPRALKVPQVGWNSIVRAPESAAAGAAGAADPWSGTPLAGLRDGEFVYFVHSYHVRPQASSVVVSTSRYGNIEFCSSLRVGNVFACQFHPERSGPAGLAIYRNFASLVSTQPDVTRPQEIAHA